jgi:hypothetical protein
MDWNRESRPVKSVLKAALYDRASQVETLKKTK